MVDSSRLLDLIVFELILSTIELYLLKKYYLWMWFMSSFRRMSNGVREKALQFLREVPRISQSNIQKLPGTKPYRKRQYGQNGKERGWGASARQKMHYAPLGYESGNTPIQRKTPFERSYNYGVHAVKQFPPLSLHQLQLAIDTGYKPRLFIFSK